MSLSSHEKEPLFPQLSASVQLSVKGPFPTSGDWIPGTTIPARMDDHEHLALWSFATQPLNMAIDIS